MPNRYVEETIVLYLTAFVWILVWIVDHVTENASLSENLVVPPKLSIVDQLFQCKNC